MIRTRRPVSTVRATASARPLLAGLAVAALALTATACGDDASSDTNAVDTTAAAVETTVAADTTADTTAPAETTAPADTAAPDTAAPETTAPALGSLVDVATAAGDFTTLLAAVEAAGLTERLATEKLTVLAPTDAAFEALGADAIAALLADPAALTAVLQNHLLPLPQDAATITIFDSVVTVAGNPLPVVVDGDTVTIGGATVVAADVLADNGVIHVIDTVLLPAG